MHNVRPSRILMRRSLGRSREILCVVRKNDDAEWLDETDVDFQQSTVSTTDLQDAYPVVTVEEKLNSAASIETARVRRIAGSCDLHGKRAHSQR
ncbi:hypothetical protein EVAR_7906_1 [Eumeta japonica]|uniref:Uncharacterized protein n=1 Tax=Eumeta variegata TaxID=151549 RepID=A0A4C1TV47_EUMVA|nr:hypothetical protein EVAR_7906_1 [Eumeta japonica]